MLRSIRLFCKIRTFVENELTIIRKSSHERFEFYEEMPKSKEYLSSDDSDSSVEKAPKRKRAKEEKRSSNDNEEKADAGKKSKGSSNDNKDTWDIGNNRVVRLNEFKGKMLIDIREMYMDPSSGELKPGKRGISLNPTQWRKFMDSVEEIDKAVKNKC